MSYQKLFPQILEKTYASCKKINSNIPLIRFSSKITGTKIISLPFLDTVNINITKEEIKKLSKLNKIEIRISELNKKFPKQQLIEEGFDETIQKGHIISILTSKEDFWRRFHKHTRNDIRKAEKSNLIIKRINSKLELKKFYNLYLKQMKLFGTPQHSFKFFKNCLQIMRQDFIGFNCYKDNKIIGTIILFIEEDYVYVPFNVSDSKFRQFRPNDFLYWNALKWSFENNKKYFDIGQIDLNPERDTRAEALLKFKRKWLGNEYKKIYLTKGIIKGTSKQDSLKQFRQIWSKLPTSIIKIAGPKICSQLGK